MRPVDGGLVLRESLILLVFVLCHLRRRLSARSPLSTLRGLRLDFRLRLPLPPPRRSTCPCPACSASSTASASRGRTRRRPQAIDDDLDVVPHLAVELQIVGELNDLAVDAGPHEALLQQVVEQVLVFALLAADDGRETANLRPCRQLHDAGDDLLARLGRDRPARTCGQCPGPMRAYSTRRNRRSR